MSCGCMNKELSTVEKMRDLAKKAAIMENKIYIVYRKKDGTYQFQADGLFYDGKLVEYVYPY